MQGVDRDVEFNGSSFGGSFFYGICRGVKLRVSLAEDCVPVEFLNYKHLQVELCSVY